MKEQIQKLRDGFETAYINGQVASDLSYQPQFVSNNYKEGKKVLSSVEDELLACEHFKISVAFITMGGIAPLLQTLKQLEQKGIKGEILTTNYLDFSEPKALEKLHSYTNITLKMYDVEAAGSGFHTKGYIFKKEEVYRIIVGSSNMTSKALTSNREWNTKILSTEQGEVAKEILAEFQEMWTSPYALSYDEFYEQYKERYEIIKRQKEIARQEAVPSIEQYRLKPNAMQVGFIQNLKQILGGGEDRALLISATGTGKTYASAFAMRELGFKRVLFLVHRGQLARQTKKSYEKVFGKSVSMGLVGAGCHDYDKDYVFATVQTLNRDEHLYRFEPDAFDCIVLDEAHHSSANTYQKVMQYFSPKLWLGMTATPDKRDDAIAGKNIYEIFHYRIAYEIRLQQAMEEDMLCPFHYYGISDLALVDENGITSKSITERDFNQLTSDERVRHIVEQAEYYGYCGERVKGLVFCSRIEESVVLSKKFNALGFRTIALNGDASEETRANAFERLAMDEEDATEQMQPLDYIFSVDILNEGVDIVEVNQVIMLRPTQSPIVFIQQLGRGLRKAEGKEYVMVLDFIGNYNRNFMIPIALSGDRTYNPDIIRKYVISGNDTIPGASSVHFDEIAKERIFQSIDAIKGMKTIIRESYQTLKSRLGRVPYLLDFYENGEIDPLVIVREFKTYQSFLENVEKESYIGRITSDENVILEYLSKTILNGARPSELVLLKHILQDEAVVTEVVRKELSLHYEFNADEEALKNTISVLQGHFVRDDKEKEKYEVVKLVNSGETSVLHRAKAFSDCLKHQEFYHQVEDIIQVGLRRYEDKYRVGKSEETPFVLYEKYGRRDVCFLMNCEKDLSSTMYGMKKIVDDVFIFVTYHKVGTETADKNYTDGKPDYADVFEDNMIFRWDSQIGRGINSSYVAEVLDAPRKHLLVKKSDAEQSFYYMGQFDVIDVKADKKEDNSGKKRDIAKLRVKMHHAVREDLLRYLQSNITED